MAAKKMPAKKAAPAKKVAPAKSRRDDVVAEYDVPRNRGSISEAAATVTKGDIASGKKARIKASQYGAITGQTTVYRYGTKNEVSINTPVKSKTGKKGTVTETRNSRRFRPDASTTKVTWKPNGDLGSARATQRAKKKK